MENYKVINRQKSHGSTKHLLKKGMVPGIIYGKNTDPSKIAFEDKKFFIAVDEEFVKMDFIITNSKEIAIFPPVTGG